MSRQQREAAEWAALMRGTPSDGDRQAFEAWRARPGNADAYAHALDDWDYSAGMSRQRIEAKVRREVRGPDRLRWAAATLAAAGLAIGFTFYVPGRGDAPRIAAAPMQPGQMTLADGTIVTLMNGASVDTQISARERRVLLNGGRARFEVAHDPARPFIVLAAGSETVALGTTFEIDTREAAPRIQLIKGSVEVRARAGGERLRLVPGQMAEVTATGPRLVETAAVSLPAALLDADELPLGAVVDAANKVGVSPIRLADPALASIRVTGRFDVTESRPLARKLAAALGLADKEQGDEIILTKE